LTDCQKPESTINLMKQTLSLFLLLIPLAILPAEASELRPFTTDGCSSFPDGPPADPDKWRNCCLEHDKAYWLGGTYAERSRADRELKTCIAQAENRVLADLMWAGVRAGGSPWWPTRFRWSYGWPYTRGYRAVTEAERKLADSLLPKEKSSE